MPDFTTIRVDVNARGIATLTLARPQKHNAINSAMIGELTEAATNLGADGSVRAVVLAADGNSFCAGADLGWMREQLDKNRAAKIAESSRFARMLSTLNAIPKPLIGRVQGPAFGGGVGLMAVCDSVVAASQAHFALTETRMGLIPATIGPFVVRRIGEGYARQIFLTARSFDADFAFRIGLVARICDASMLDDVVALEIEPVFGTDPDAVGRAKALCRSLLSADPNTVFETTAIALADCWESDATVAAIETFLRARKG